MLLILLAFIFLQVSNSFGLVSRDLLWDKQSSEFISLMNISTFRKLYRTYYQRSLDTEKARLQGETIRIGYHEDINLFMFEENSTKITGLLGDLWTMLSEYLNFTINAIKVTDSSDLNTKLHSNFTGLLGMIERKEIDIIPRALFHESTWDIIEYSTPLWTNRFRIYVQPEFVSDDSWIFKTFTLHSWLSTIGVITSFSVIGIFIDKLAVNTRLISSSYVKLFLDHYFYTFATFCNQGSFPEDIEKRSLCMTFCRRACAFLVISMLSSTLVSHMTSKEMKLSFTGVQDLLNNTDYTLVLRNTTLSFTDMKTEVFPKKLKRYKERLLMVDTANEMYQIVCNGGNKFAALGADDRQRAMAHTMCKLIAAPENYFPMWVTSGIVKGFKFRRPIDNGILKIIEVGLLTALKDRWLIRELSWPTVITTDVSIKQVYLIFAVLLVGIMISLIIFTIENMIVIRRRYHLRKRWNNQLHHHAKRLEKHRRVRKTPKTTDQPK